LTGGYALARIAVMSKPPEADRGRIYGVPVSIFPSGRALGAAAAADAASLIRAAIQARGWARIMIGTGNSQLETIDALTRLGEIEWSKVEAFHLDEYVGISAQHPASFRRWLRTRFAEKVRPGAMHYLEGDAADLAGELKRYGARLLAAPIDLAFVGIGENGHIAFNDPPLADFDDPLTVKRVTLDEACRRQQVGEGHFPSLNAVPAEAVTVTCSGLMRAQHWICCVPELRKAPAVKASLEIPISTRCPGTLVRRHPRAALYLDIDSASLLAPPQSAVK